MVLNRNRLIANSSEKNPLVKDLANSLQSMQRTIIQSVDNLIVSLNTQIRSIRQQEVTTTSQLASNPSQAKYLLSVERQQKVKEELYLYLLQKREENELSQAFTAYNTRVITAPRGSMAPVSPQKMNILLMAFALGLAVPAGVIFLKENMNSKVRGRKDLEHLSLPLVGEIPLYGCEKKSIFGRKPLRNKRVVVVEEGNRNVINEAFRVLRSNLDLWYPILRKLQHLLSHRSIRAAESLICRQIWQSALPSKGKKYCLLTAICVTAPFLPISTLPNWD